MILAAIVLMAGLYACGFVRAAHLGRRFPRLASLWFALGLGVLGMTVLGPLDGLADASLSWHMAQHLLLVSVVAPLFLLGAPARLALSALPARAASGLARVLISVPVRVLTHPVFAWLQFAVVLYGIHYSPLYEAALTNETVHAFEHVLFLASGLIFWMPLLAVAPAPHAPAYPVRLLAIFLALPMSAFLGFTFYVERHVLYAHYALRPGALADQMNAGAVMWIAGCTPLIVALLWTVADWGERERRRDLAYGGTQT